MKNFKYDIVIIGIGRVGLPLALSFLTKGLRVVGVDIDKKLISDVNNKIFPFQEKGYDEIIKNYEFYATEDPSIISDSKNIIITVGTPLNEHIETDLKQIVNSINSMIKFLREGHNIILRSTIAPGTTTFVKNYLEQKIDLRFGKNIFLSFCPERIVEGQARIEFESLPQVIGSEDEESYNLANEIFSKLAPEVLKTDFISAELVKLFNNISRYINFSVANQFSIIADTYDVDIYNIIHMTNYKYPRGTIEQPGFTAGTCLRKDFGMINESIPYTDLLLSAWKINEFMPKFLVENTKKRIKINNKNISVLGYTFKKDVDDVRDSLIPKLIRYLERETPKKIFVNDPNLGKNIDENYNNVELNSCIPVSDIIYFAINHKEYEKDIKKIISLSKKGTWIIDLWNVSKKGKIFYKV